MIIIRLIFLFSNIIIIKLGTTPDKEPPSVVSVMDHSTQSLKLNFPISNQYHTSTQIFAPSTTSMRKRKVRKSCPNLLVSQATTGEIQHKSDNNMACLSLIKTRDSEVGSNFCVGQLHCRCDTAVPKQYYEFTFSYSCSWFWHICSQSGKNTLNGLIKQKHKSPLKEIIQNITSMSESTNTGLFKNVTVEAKD